MNNELKGFMLLDSLLGMSVLLLVVTLVCISTNEFSKLENTAYHQLLAAQALLNKSEQRAQTLSSDKIRKEGISVTAYDGKKVQLFISEK